MTSRAFRKIRGTLFSPAFFKAFFVVALVLMALSFIFYTRRVIDALGQDARKVSNVYAMLWQYAATEAAPGPEMNLIFEEIIRESSFPVVVTDSEGNPILWRGVGVPMSDTTREARRELEKVIARMDRQYDPIPIGFGQPEVVINYLHYGEPPIVTQLRWMPVLQGGLLVLFLVVGYIGIRNIKRSEQHFIWVGMAKETAHQLGTPLSSLLGWLELLRLRFADRKLDSGPADRGDTAATIGEIAQRMTADIDRLERVANRFGQIGSVPELKPYDLNKVVADVASYFRLRLPGKGQGIQLTETYGELPPVLLNSELISWVVENLLKNSLEAVDPVSGRIDITTGRGKSDREVVVYVSDNGRGIGHRLRKKIFKPGFTTKKRGWGLGLTLAKRIVEEYHSGKITVSESIPGLGTTIQITLPVQDRDGSDNGDPAAETSRGSGGKTNRTRARS